MIWVVFLLELIAAFVAIGVVRKTGSRVLLALGFGILGLGGICGGLLSGRILSMIADPMAAQAVGLSGSCCDLLAWLLVVVGMGMLPKPAAAAE